MNKSQKAYLYAAVLIVIGVFNLLDGVYLYLRNKYEPEYLPAETYSPLPEKKVEENADTCS